MEEQLNDLEKKWSEMLKNVTAPNIDEIDKQCIYRVPTNIRKHNPKAYTPQIVSIGPYHHNGIKPTGLKLKYVKAFLDRKKLSEKVLFAKIKEICKNTNSIRSCYAETIECNDVDLLTMIFVDAFFIIELFLRWREPHVWEEKDHIMLKPWMRLGIKHDLMLLENQLPFSVLEQLYNLTNEPLPNTNEPLLGTTNESFRGTTNESLRVTPSFFKMCVNCIGTGTNCFNCMRTKEPLIGTNETLTGTNEPNFRQICFNCLKSTSFESECPAESPKHFTDLLRSSIISLSKINHGNQNEREEDIKHVYSASQLMEAGLEFKVSPNKSFLDLELSEDDRVLSMPILNINASTQLYFKNMIAYERSHHSATKIITQYVAILYFLIKTEKDLNILVDKKIIVNWSGDAENVVTIINNLGSSMSMPDFIPYYCSICTRLNKFYENPLNKYKAIFIHDYFNTPWKKASTIAAIVLLFLTFIQTVCSIMSVVQSKK
ncbi:hypothetical protein DEO72_LG5g2542 [Vigna unguiculata]|uniref:Uncharacterized protein n=1 Tax=Vigna unguiculata TaxID=3917 RepID=A0A4D6M1I4_VIGUN|nr:hypothetical protein DEO72_LG5g2213 [Vigna unguiculata]QCD94458.1 hypothetical protein DEO72_LG5g2542 [Vigna unguiculata]